jgi:hypothetical protein
MPALRRLLHLVAAMTPEEVRSGGVDEERLEAIRQKDEPLAKDVTEQVFDNARVAAGILEDPRAMLGRLNQLLEKVLR